ncbi:MAG: helix-turn-helix transcriptional regulator [Oligoflexia bacterium]|nr:helix-turn-helix transcriptional regulator [Oligoflexia bacterium]
MGNKKKSISEYTLPERLVYLRGLRDLSQADLAKKSGLSQSTIAHIENGKKDPSVATLKKIAAALDVHIAVLFATDSVHVFDMQRLRKKYDSVDKLNPTLYTALGKVIAWAKDVGFLK